MTTNFETSASFYTHKEALIDNAYHVWLHLTSTPIGDIWIVQYEHLDMQIETFMFFNDYDKAMKKFKSCVNKLSKEVFR